LGVYLGLVLVGATPQVMAQAAMRKAIPITYSIGTPHRVEPPIWA